MDVKHLELGKKLISARFDLIFLNIKLTVLDGKK